MAVKRFPIEAGAIALFARSVNDPNPIYYDEEHAKKSEVGGVIAPPTFTQSSAQFDPDWMLRPRIDQPWLGSGKEPTGLVRRAPAESSGGGGGGGGRPSGAAAGGLHAEQHFEYFRPLHPGDVLRAETKPGKSWEKEGKRGGKLHFSETVTEFFDQQGQLVVRARGVGVRTERVIEQK